MMDGRASPEELLTRAGATFRRRRPQADTLRPHGKPVPLAMLEPATWTAAPPARQWIVPDWVPVGTVSALYGDGGIGKSLLAQQLLTCTALGAPWLGLDVMQGRTLGIFCEDEPDELKRRQAAINAALDVEPERLGNLRLISRLGEENLLMDFSENDTGQFTSFFHNLDLTLAAWSPILLVLDTAADLFGGNENIRPQVRRFVGTCLGRLARDHGCGVLLLAHPSQAGIRDGSGSGGSTAWNNTVRSRLYLTREEDDGGVITMPDRRVLTRMKSNYAGPDGRIEMAWRKGAFVLPGLHDAADAATWPAIRALFDEVERAWNDGKPWSQAVQTRKDGRYLPAWAKQHLGMPEKRTVGLVGDWLMNGCLAIEEVDTHSKMRGLRVLRRPDQ